jgi:hypothetical protein
MLIATTDCCYDDVLVCLFQGGRVRKIQLALLHVEPTDVRVIILGNKLTK